MQSWVRAKILARYSPPVLGAFPTRDLIEKDVIFWRKLMIELRVLGSVSLRADDGHVINAVLAQPKRFALLAYLASSPPETQRQRDTIVGMLWSEMPDRWPRRAAPHGA